MMNNLHKTKNILKIAIPSGLGSFLDIINVSMTLAFVGKLSTSHIVALGAGTNFVVLFYSIFAIFFTGSNAIISRLYGQKSPHLQDAISSLCLSAMCISIPLLLIATTSFMFYLHWLGLKENALNLALIYLQIIVFEIPFLLLKSTLSSIFSATSKAEYPFYIKLLCTILHIGLNYVLIFGWGNFEALDIKGAALSNIICSVLEVLLLLFFLHRIFGLRKAFCITFVKNAFKVGLPTGIERFSTLFSLILVAKFFLFYGDNILAGSQIGGRIEAFVFMPGFGFMIASMTLMGQNTHNLPLAKSYTTLCLWISSCLMGILGICIALGGKHLALFFTQDAQVIIYTWHYLIAVGLSQVPLIFVFVLDGALRGAGKTLASLCINVLSIWGLRILPMYLCSLMQLPYFFIFGLIFLETYLRACLFWIFFYKVKWKIQN